MTAAIATPHRTVARRRSLQVDRAPEALPTPASPELTERLERLWRRFSCDLDRIQRAMVAMDWKWYYLRPRPHVPTTGEIRRHVLFLIAQLAEHGWDDAVAAGGFSVWCRNGEIGIEWGIVDFEGGDGGCLRPLRLRKARPATRGGPFFCIRRRTQGGAPPGATGYPIKACAPGRIRW